MLRLLRRLGYSAESHAIFSRPSARFGAFPLSQKSSFGQAINPAVRKKHGLQAFLNPVLAIHGNARPSALAFASQLHPHLRGEHARCG